MHMYLAVDINFHSQLHSTLFFLMVQRQHTHTHTHILSSTRPTDMPILYTYTTTCFWSLIFRLFTFGCALCLVRVCQCFWYVLHNDRYLSAVSDRVHVSMVCIFCKTENGRIFFASRYQSDVTMCLCALKYHFIPFHSISAVPYSFFLKLFAAHTYIHSQRHIEIHRLLAGFCWW